jgi:nucleotide-binding universal stress UspA family protein
MNENGNKLLVALDGSEKAFRTIEYLSSFKPFLMREIVLYTVFNAVPECYYDMNAPFSQGNISRVRAWETACRTKLEEFMEKARMMLIAAGFAPETITIAIEKMNKGIARDILSKAQEGYYALVTRRRGTAASLLPIIMGSVSTKLVEKGMTVPILLAGSLKVNHSILIAIDGSEGSKRAISFLGRTVENSDCRIVLCSVLRDYGLYDDKEDENITREFVKKSFEEIDQVIEYAARYLESVGIKKEKIEHKIIQGAKSRAGAIIEAAREENCDTIVFGRKGRSNTVSFDIGRVPWKVIHGARESTIWIIP